MIVNVTMTQAQEIDAVAGDGLLADTMRRDRVPVKTRCDITAPFVAWEIITQRLMERHLSPTLGRTMNTPMKVLRLLTAISKANNKYVRHPVWRGSAMQGIVDGWFPAWRFPEPVGDYLYSPRPTPGGVFVLLGPDYQLQNKADRITMWTQFGLVPTSHWLASEDAHTRLIAEHS